MTEPLGLTDVDALDDLLASDGWALLRARLAFQLERESRELENDRDLAPTAKARGAIAALRMAMQLPQAMREELAGQVKHGA